MNLIHATDSDLLDCVRIEPYKDETWYLGALTVRQFTVPEIVHEAGHPGLAALSARAEKLPAFLETGYS